MIAIYMVILRKPWNLTSIKKYGAMSKVNIILLTKHLGIIMKYYVNTTICEFQHYGLSQSTLVLPSNTVPSLYHGDTLVYFIWVTKTSHASTMI